MSAWVCGDAHLCYLLEAARNYGHGRPGVTWFHNGQTRAIDALPNSGYYVGRCAEDVGQTLRAENEASVRALYQSREPGQFEDYPYTYTPRGVALTLDPVTVLKSIQCYEYQSDNGDGWRASEARAFCASLRSAAITKLPGYDAAPWGIDQ